MQFHGYSVDAVHRTITKPDGGVIRLEPKACDLLLYFAAHPGEVLSREQLIAAVWNGKFVTDDAVMVAVYALRQAFDDDAKKPRFIETIRGRGYRWTAVPGGRASRPHRPAVPADRSASGETPAARERDARPPTLTVLWALLIALGMAAFLWAVVRPAQPMPSIEKTNALVRAHARGVFFSERRTRADLERAIEEFRGAIALDERFAEPHAALAEVHVRLIELGAEDPASHEAAARREVKRALALAPRLALSHAARGSVEFVLDRDVARAEESFRYAMTLDPTLPGIRRRYSYLLGATGRFSEAMDQARVAANLEPASSNALGDLAWTHVLAGRPADAERLYREALRLDPANVDAHFSLGYCLDLRNAPDEAMQSYRRALQLIGAPEASLAELDHTFAASGLRGVYASWLERFQARGNAPRFVLAFYAARAGRSSDAIALLRESSARREVGTLWLAVHPAFAPLRGQREFDALVASSFHAR